jgi:LmbE family N-acetylglucosaminyl deacetylase
MRGLKLALLAIGLAGPSSGVRYLSNASDVKRDLVIVAHQDDWQLFMGDVVAARLKAGDSVIFVYLTAGDDGRDSLYWRTRELAAMQSTRVAIATVVADSGAAECSTARVLAHSIQRCVIANTVSYFLRLPDGKRNGAGFTRYGFQSLRKLRQKKATAMTAVDGSATYRGWSDLMATIRSLISTDSANTRTVVLTTDPSKRVNPHDHFDHRVAGLLVNDLRPTQGWTAEYYVGYALGTRAANRSTPQAREKTAIFRAYDMAMMRVNKSWSAYEEHPAFYSQCMLRTYARKPRAIQVH